MFWKTKEKEQDALCCLSLAVSASICVNQLFPIRLVNLPFSITAAEMAPFTEQLLPNLFKALTLPGSSENEYIMKGEPEFDNDALHLCSTLGYTNCLGFTTRKDIIFKTC